MTLSDLKKKYTLKLDRKLMKSLGIVVITGFIIAMGTAFFADNALAQQLSLDLGEQGSLTGRVMQMILLLTVLSLAPSILVTVTSFTRIVVVLSILRNALGTQQTPPNIVLVSLALFLTGFIMAPTFEESYKAGIEPMIEGQIEEAEAFDLASKPFKIFMLTNVRESDLQLFLEIRGGDLPETALDTPFSVLVPAFMISELRRAFEIGFLLYIPFLVIDLVVASILMSMGMMMLPPVMLSLPFKLIFFVMVDGWNLVASSLVQSFSTGPPL
jgi:flagellar biosynthetic protein FliP